MAEVDEVSRAVGVAEKHKTSATKIPGLRMNDGQRETGGYRGINRVAPSTQHFSDASARRKFVDAGDEGMRRMGRPQGRACCGSA